MRTHMWQISRQSYPLKWQFDCHIWVLLSEFISGRSGARYTPPLNGNLPPDCQIWVLQSRIICHTGNYRLPFTGGNSYLPDQVADLPLHKWQFADSDLIDSYSELISGRSGADLPLMGGNLWSATWSAQNEFRSVWIYCKYHIGI